MGEGKLIDIIYPSFYFIESYGGYNESALYITGCDRGIHFARNPAGTYGSMNKGFVQIHFSELLITISIPNFRHCKISR